MPEALATTDRVSAGRRRGRAIVVRVAVLVVVIAVLAGAVVGVLVEWWVGLLLAVLLAAAAWFVVVVPRLRQAQDRALRLVGPVREADEAADARFINLVEGLAPTAGLPRPRCFVADDPSVNLLALGQDPRQGCIVATSGLLQGMSRMELEAVVAHAIVRLRDGGTIAATLAVSLTGGRGPLANALGAPDLATVDLEAVRLTRFPPALASALRVTSGTAIADQAASGSASPSPPVGSASGSPSTPRAADAVLAPLWFAPPGDAASVAVRIEAIEEL